MNTPTPPWPHWATGTAEGRVQIGAVLPTRDGRNMGNAVVTGFTAMQGKHFWYIRTDAGNLVTLSDEEIDGLFWPPEWLKEPADLQQRDKAALDRIAEIMSGEEWDSSTTDAIRDVVIGAGREIKDIDDEDEQEAAS